MKDYSYVFNAHPSFIDSMYKKYKADPSSVEDGWRSFFQGFEFRSSDEANPLGDHTESLSTEFNVLELINGYRDRGHLLSKTNPIRQRRDRHPDLDLNYFGLSEADLDGSFKAGNQLGLSNASLSQIIDKLNRIYCGPIGFEYTYIEDSDKRRWLQERIETRELSGGYGLEIDQKKRILEKLNEAVVFEKFLHTKYVGQKRFSLEGGETAIVAIDTMIDMGVENGVEEVLIGMAHRGRLNVLANIMGKTYEQIFNEFEGTAVPDLSFGDGDVKYHLGFASKIKTHGGKSVHLKLAPNPSHLESVDPVLLGWARAKADILYKSDYDKILPILIHGDAAIAGQGVVYESVQMSKLPGYYTGGTIHFVINNQIGFTTNFDDARSATYCTGVASMVQAPVFHVNGDNPEAVVFAVKLAVEYRQKFNNDVFIDMVCYRKHGHNEGDDPKFTQPQMYDIIKTHPNPREQYLKVLLERGDIEKKMAETLEKKYWSELQARLDLVKQTIIPYEMQEPEKAWQKLKLTVDPNDFEESPKTGVAKSKLDKVVDHLMTIPDGFTPLSKIARLQKGKQKLLDAGKVDWALAELLSYGCYLIDGRDIRISGQDVKRGTFSHRHAVFNDAKTFEEKNRFDNLSKDQGRFMIYNSLLSEFAVLGFEYGYSLATPENLVIWEAQFGDFYNGAQTIVDQYISAAESKWQWMSGLVMLLPHGYAGQGPEHSSARLERFLQQGAQYNLSIVNISNPANFFHVLQRQVKRPFRKPLIVMSPKSLLRHPAAVSDLSEMHTGTRFRELIPDQVSGKKKIHQLLICSGKIFYDLDEYRTTNKISDTYILRVEQLFPFPSRQVEKIIKDLSPQQIKYVQEEPANMGAANFIADQLTNYDLEVISRKPSASPATGFKKIHDQEQNDILERAFKK